MMRKYDSVRSCVRDALRAAPLFLLVPLAVLLFGIADGRADGSGYMAAALVCRAETAIADCDRSTALDIAVQPVALVTECGQVGMLLAAHLILQPGERHKIVCERRKG